MADLAYPDRCPPVTLPPAMPRPLVPRYLRDMVTALPHGVPRDFAQAGTLLGTDTAAIVSAAVAGALSVRAGAQYVPLAVGMVDPAGVPVMRTVTIDVLDPLASAVVVGKADAMLRAGEESGQGAAGPAVAVMAGHPEQWRSVRSELADRDIVFWFDAGTGSLSCDFDSDLYPSVPVEEFCGEVLDLVEQVVDAPDLPLLAEEARRTVEKAGESPAGPAAGQQSGAPDHVLTPAQDALAGIWAQVLGIEASRIAASSDFFALGGHSLLAAQVVMHLHDVCRADVTVEDVFRHASLSDLATFVEQGAARDPAGPIPPAPADGPFPLTPAQLGIWLAEQLAPGTGRYNLPLAWTITGPLDRTALRTALNAVVARHDMLRTSIERAANGDPLLRTSGTSGVVLEEADLSAAAPDEIERRIAAAVNTPFDLTESAMRVLLARLAGQVHVLVLVVHHIMCDQWSCAQIVRELGDEYAGRGIRPAVPEISYRDYAHWHASRLEERMPALRDHWSAQVADVQAPCLPVTRRPGGAPACRAGRHEFPVPADLHAGLRDLGQRHQATVFMTLFAAFLVLLRRYGDEPDLAVCTSVTGRDHPQLEDLVGSFADLLLLRTRAEQGQSFGELIHHARETILNAYAHQGYPLQEALQDRRRGSGREAQPMPLIFQYLSIGTCELELGDASVRERTVRTAVAKYDLMITFEARGRELSGVVEYREDTVDPADIAWLMDGYQRLLREIVADPDQTIEQLGCVVPAGPIGSRPDAAARTARDAHATLSDDRHNALHVVLSRLWAEELELESVGIDDHFFDLGGHSLTAVRLLARVQSLLEVQVPLCTVLTEGTVAAMAAYIEGRQSC
jgi:acyl carrier protein